MGSDAYFMVVLNIGYPWLMIAWWLAVGTEQERRALAAHVVEPLV